MHACMQCNWDHTYRNHRLFISTETFHAALHTAGDQVHLGGEEVLAPVVFVLQRKDDVRHLSEIQVIPHGHGSGARSFLAKHGVVEALVDDGRRELPVGKA